MTNNRLLKGFEVELFTGHPDGRNVGIAAEASQELAGFVTEPDHRNLEYITAPQSDYGPLTEALLAPRRTLRTWLQPRGLTLLPGSTLSLGDTTRFERSDPSNPYHDLIEATYGTDVVTASIHINLGIESPQDLFKALRLVQLRVAGVAREQAVVERQRVLVELLDDERLGGRAHRLVRRRPARGARRAARQERLRHVPAAPARRPDETPPEAASDRATGA